MADTRSPVSATGPPVTVTRAPVTDGYREAMGLALAEADLARAAGDVPVGAVVVAADGAVLGRGHNAREAAGDPTAHAEVVALRQAAARLGSWRLTGATLVVTLEPCTMCAGALVLARVDRLVYGAVDDKAGAVGSLWDVVRDRRLNHRPEVVAGVRGQECSEQLAAFFADRRTQRRDARRPRTPD
ncbi:CMP/dCMP deaminase zinc-binding [Parafrankia sp. EAN1pec]|uniref:tRNA adenosine(34) deaminase TadA n=1 Tax=Parafrankia sp. (strain EAN1pec) TaxID=298653 RepID=UPI0000542805|nr:CMP/dCMP deaminase zinc-binding [Frankia sp. EAN1pec]